MHYFAQIDTRRQEYLSAVKTAHAGMRKIGGTAYSYQFARNRFGIVLTLGVQIDTIIVVLKDAVFFAGTNDYETVIDNTGAPGVMPIVHRTTRVLMSLWHGGDGVRIDDLYVYAHTGRHLLLFSRTKRSGEINIPPLATLIIEYARAHADSNRAVAGAIGLAQTYRDVTADGAPGEPGTRI